MKNKTCIVIAGPTAVGKTSLALQIAQLTRTQIISADSRQCYREMEIGVAKPSIKEREMVMHHFIDSHSINEKVNAAVFEAYALQKVEDIFKDNDIAVMVGGTGLYIKAFCEGMDEIPPVDTEVRKSIATNYSNGGFEWLREQVKINDSSYFASGEIQNPHRLMRALEVKLSTGRSITEFQAKQKKQRNFKIVKIGLEMPRAELYKNIDNRVDVMMQKGLLEEVKSLHQFRHLNALQTVGYQELFNHLSGELSLDEAVETIKKNTRHYAKRQMTWFKKDAEIKWFASSDITAILSYLQKSTGFDTCA